MARAALVIGFGLVSLYMLADFASAMGL